jgi:hypothetical protein
VGGGHARQQPCDTMVARPDGNTDCSHHASGAVVSGLDKGSGSDDPTSQSVRLCTGSRHRTRRDRDLGSWLASTFSYNGREGIADCGGILYRLEQADRPQERLMPLATSQAKRLRYVRLMPASIWAAPNASSCPRRITHSKDTELKASRPPRAAKDRRAMFEWPTCWRSGLHGGARCKSPATTSRSYAPRSRGTQTTATHDRTATSGPLRNNTVRGPRTGGPRRGGGD